MSVQIGEPSPTRRAGHEPRRYDFVDALRGLAVLGVVVVHTAQNFHPRAFESALGLGQYGVQLFYIVSAFSLCLSLDQRSRNERRSLLNYGLRRFFRIAPMFYVALVVYLALPHVAPATAIPVNVNPVTWPLRAWHVAATVLFVNGWHHESINLIVPGGWSVAIETNFYLVLPFLHRFATSLRRAVVLFGVTLVAAIAFRKGLYLIAESHVPPHEEVAFGIFSSMWLPSQLPVFTLGLVMARVFERLAPSGASTTAEGRLRGGLEASLAGLIVTAALAAALPRVAGRLVSPYVQISLVLLFFALTVAQRPVRAIVNRATIALGRISYSVYLTHFVVLHLVIWAGVTFYEPRFHARPPFVAAFAVVLGLTVVLSTATYRAIELPGQDLGRRLIRRLERSAT